jgi:arylesterase/paraoxonase
MKRILLFVGVPLLFLAIFVYDIMNSTGFFRPIDEVGTEKIIKRIPIVGAEDIVISPDSEFAIISSDDRASRRDGNEKQGALYYLSLDDYTYHSLTDKLEFDFFPHGISIYKKDSARYVLHVINHVAGEHFVELFELDGNSLIHKEKLRDPLMISPNDIVSIDGKRFYFTNDHGSASGLFRFMEDYLGLARSNVIYFDGSGYREVASKIAYANGIQADLDRNLLFVASPRGFLIKVYEITSDNALKFIEDIDCGTGVDNIEFDENGNLWVGCHPNLLAFASYASGKREVSPSEIIRIQYKGTRDYSIQQVYMDDGSEMSGATVAANNDNVILVGNVMDDAFLILKK